jgi:hypothetical protein
MSGLAAIIALAAKYSTTGLVQRRTSISTTGLTISCSYDWREVGEVSLMSRLLITLPDCLDRVVNGALQSLQTTSRN